MMHAPLAALHGVFGTPPPRLAAAPADARQFSPTIPGAAALDAADAGTLAGMTMLAPPGTTERRYALAAMLRALAPGAPFTVLAPKTAGGSRLAEELAGFGCPIEIEAKAHHRICRGTRPPDIDQAASAEASAAGAPRRLEALGLWTQPGVFSWDRIDAGTTLLLETLPPLRGRGADLGCGIGILAHAVLAAPEVTRLDLVDIDRRAIEAARRNVDDPRAAFSWSDLRDASLPDRLDFIVMNPPFHQGGAEDKGLGRLFLRRAAGALRSGGELWLVANRHLPYEAEIAALFRRVTPMREAHGYKVVSATR